MKNIILYTVLFVAFLAVPGSGCKKEDVSNKTVPTWVVATPGNYPYTMTAVVGLPKSLSQKTDAGDQFGAFIGSECRGVGTMQIVSDNPVFFVLVHGTSSEKGKLDFRYFNSKSGKIYTSTDTVFFTVDDFFGTVDNPKILTMKKLP